METVESPRPMTHHPAPQAMICSRNRSRNLFISCARCAGSCPCTAKCDRSPLPRLPFDLCGVVLHPLFCSRLAGFRGLFRCSSVSRCCFLSCSFADPRAASNRSSLITGCTYSSLRNLACSLCQECRHRSRGRCRSLGCCPEPYVVFLMASLVVDHPSSAARLEDCHRSRVCTFLH